VGPWLFVQIQSCGHFVISQILQSEHFNWLRWLTTELFVHLRILFNLRNSINKLCVYVCVFLSVWPWFNYGHQFAGTNDCSETLYEHNDISGQPIRVDFNSGSELLQCYGLLQSGPKEWNRIEGKSSCSLITWTTCFDISNKYQTVSGKCCTTGIWQWKAV
jgi:hypothetical protein